MENSKRIYTANLSGLQAFLNDHQIRFFSAKELTLQRRWHQYVIPSLSIWWHIIHTLEYADKLRSLLGRLRVVSGYRCYQYNQEVGGARNSQHMAFRALDLQPLDSGIDEIKEMILHYWHQWRNTSASDMGIGGYATFIHIDFGFKRRKWGNW